MAHAKILMVDPEPQLYEPWKGALAKHGYELHLTVLPATALALAGAHGYQVALVALSFLDHTTFFHELQTELPGVEVIVTLPPAYNALLPATLLPSVLHTLGKPYTLEMLCLLLDRTLELLTLRERLRRQRQESCAPQQLPQEQWTSAGVMGSLATHLTQQLRQLVMHTGRLGRGTLHQMVLSYVEKLLLSVVLAECRGNQVKSAEILGINRNTLRKKIREYSLSVSRGHGGN